MLSALRALSVSIHPTPASKPSSSSPSQGGYRACNRLGIESSTSPFLKISFETGEQGPGRGPPLAALSCAQNASGTALTPSRSRRPDALFRAAGRKLKALP